MGPQDTLNSAHLNRPLCLRRDASKVPAARIATQLCAARDRFWGDERSPETEALRSNASDGLEQNIRTDDGIDFESHRLMTSMNGSNVQNRTPTLVQT